MVFSFLNAFVLRVLPSVEDANRVVMIESRRGGNSLDTSYADCTDWRQPSRAIARMAAIDSFSPIVTGGVNPSAWRERGSPPNSSISSPRARFWIAISPSRMCVRYRAS